MTTKLEQDRFAIVELMGHRRFGARISEVDMFGTKLMRAEILGPRPGEVVAEQFVGGGSIYALTIVTEERARSINTPYQLAGALPLLPDVAGEADRLRHEDDGDADAPCRCGHIRGSHVAGADECCDEECGCGEYARANPRGGSITSARAGARSTAT